MTKGKTKLQQIYELLQERECTREEIHQITGMSFDTIRTYLFQLSKIYGAELETRTIGNTKFMHYKITCKEIFNPKHIPIEKEKPLTKTQIMVKMMKERPCTVAEVCEATGLTQSGLNSCLKKVRQAYGKKFKVIKIGGNRVKYFIESNEPYKPVTENSKQYEYEPPVNIKKIGYIDFPKQRMGKDELIEWADALPENHVIKKKNLSCKNIFDIFVRQGGQLADDREHYNPESFSQKESGGTKKVLFRRLQSDM